MFFSLAESWGSFKHHMLGAKELTRDPARVAHTRYPSQGNSLSIYYMISMLASRAWITFKGLTWLPPYHLIMGIRLQNKSQKGQTKLTTVPLLSKQLESKAQQTNLHNMTPRGWKLRWYLRVLLPGDASSCSITWNHIYHVNTLGIKIHGFIFKI